MFKEIGQVMGLMKQLPKIKEEMDRLQQRLAQITAEGDAGAGMVKVRVNGKQEVIACTLSEEAVKTGDRELLGELVRGRSIRRWSESANWSPKRQARWHATSVCRRGWHCRECRPGHEVGPPSEADLFFVRLGSADLPGRCREPSGTRNKSASARRTYRVGMRWGLRRSWTVRPKGQSPA